MINSFTRIKVDMGVKGLRFVWRKAQNNLRIRSSLKENKNVGTF